MPNLYLALALCLALVIGAAPLSAEPDACSFERLRIDECSLIGPVDTLPDGRVILMWGCGDEFALLQAVRAPKTSNFTPRAPVELSAGSTDGVRRLR